MGSFKGHLVPGSLFLMVGIWHTWSALVRYVANPKSFRVQAWNEVPGFGGKLRHLELYLIVVGSFFDLCIELLYSPHLKFFVNGELNPSHLNNFEHSGMLIMFLIFGLVALVSEKTRFLPLPEGALCLAIASAFCAEYLLFYFHSTTHKGLEGYYHFILVLLIGLCIISSIAGPLLPTSFPVDLANGIAVTLQGLWFYQTAFSLYGPMMPDGCRLEGDVIVCGSTGSRIRGEYFANVQLFGMVLGVFVAIAVSYGFLASSSGSVHAARLRTEQDVY